MQAPRPIPALLAPLFFCLCAGWGLWAAQLLEDDQGVEFALPADWPEGLAAPLLKPNCVRCHINEKPALAAPVGDFAGGAHDHAENSCENCHGGDSENDALAHETGFVKGTMKFMARCSTCHRRENRAFTGSVHYLKEFTPTHPVCATCHEVHSIGKRRLNLGEACAKCHEPGTDGAAKVAPYADLIAASDELWGSLASLKANGAKNPEELDPEIDRVRARTMELIHSSAAAPDHEKVKSAAEASRALKARVDEYLNRPPAP